MARSTNPGNGGRASITKIVIAVMLCVSMSGGNFAYADILRGGAGRGNSPAGRTSEGRTTTPGAETAAAARLRAQDRLSRTTQAIAAMRAVQASAQSRSSASVRAAGPVPDGLRPGGLQLAVGANARLSGALAPEANGRTVTIRQTEAQAVLHWETFNVSKRTTVYFDQKNGGVDSAKWIAFNKIIDPSGKPSQILGSIRADGQVYILNPNGIIFGPGSQVNARSLVASALPINDALIERGLLNQNAGNPEFLLSAIPQGGFVPPTIFTQSGRPGNVIVDVGARLLASVSAEGSGGRIILAGANVENRGIISTPSGQTILAAGSQVGFDAHSSSDPSLRGLDVYVGAVGTGGGTVRNEGLIEIQTGSLTMAGKSVEQMGVIDSATTVTLNGRIDLLANYDAVPNIEFNPNATGAGNTFLARQSGNVLLGSESVTRIVPDLLSAETTVGKELPIRSQLNIQGLNAFFAEGSIVQVPSGDVNIQAGTWRPVTFPNGLADGRGSRLAPDFAFDKGQIYLDPTALIDVSGTVDVFVPLSESILEVQLRGNELAIAPVQRDGAIRGKNLVIDIRRTGTFNGRQWIGTPLGDASGFLNLIQRNAAQLTAAGGNVNMQAGQAVIVRENASVDVSGGYFRNEGGRIQTSRLLAGGNIVEIEDATPDRIYDGFYSGLNTETSAKWGISETFRNPLELTGARMEAETLSGAAGGKLSITAPGMVLDGNFLGQTVTGPRQVRKTATSSELPGGSTLRLEFKYQDPQVFATGLLYPDRSPTPPAILFGSDQSQLTADGFDSKGEEPIRKDRLSEIIFPADYFERTGFGRVEIANADGDFRIPRGAEIEIPERGGLTVSGRNISIEGSIRSPGGQLAFTAFNISPFEATILRSDPVVEMPEIDSTHGTITVGEQARLDVSGVVIDDRRLAQEREVRPIVKEGGQIRLTGYNVDLQSGSVLDVSGGIHVDSRRRYSFGNAGVIQIEAGQDPNLRSILGGRLNLGAELRGFSGAVGGTLSIRAPRIQVGGVTPDSNTLALQPEFFNTGGFTRFNLTGIGAIPLPSKKKVVVVDPDAPDPFIPAVYFVPGTVIEPVALGYAFENNPNPQGYVGLRPAVLPNGERTPVSLSFSAPGVTRDFVDVAGGFVRGEILVRGDIVMPESAVIRTEPGGSVSLNGQTVTVGGQIIAPGGSISVTGANSFPLPGALSGSATFARPTVHLTNTAILSAAGETLLIPDDFGRRAAIVFDGGSISVAGNILAEASAVLDVSGTQNTVDVHPSNLGNSFVNSVPANAGLNSQPYGLRTVRTQVDSDGGSISLLGSQMLLSDATLLGAAGGPTGVGGTLAVSSGRFYVSGETQLGSDINLIVTQSDRSIPFVKDKDNPVVLGVGRPVYDADSAVIKGIGVFAMDRFSQGGFDSLDLGFASGGSGVSRGGNVEFQGPVSIVGRGFVRIASGGIIKSDSTVSVAAPYVALGQEFRAPVNPSDEPFVPFTRVDVGSTGQEFVQPETGTGRLQVNARLIDVGTLVLKQIGTASLSAAGGDIRGSGTLSIQGNLALEASQIYPTSQSEFNIFAYDSPDKPGSVTISRSGVTRAPLAAGGSLGIYASNIFHSGSLVVPFGSITLGWDGTDLDPSTPAVDAPVNPVTGTALPIPQASRVILARGSTTSVSGIDPTTGEELLIPFGLSQDALTLLDARGVDVTASGLPQKRISIAGDQVELRGGSLVDLRGGGDLLAYRFIPGNGGPTDILGTATETFRANTSYAAGDLVLTSDGRTWAARVALDPGNFATAAVPSPSIGEFWSQVADSYAVVPGYSSAFAPRAPFNTGSAASALGGNPGFSASNLAIGEQIRLDAGSGLPEGVYTLLPRRYALLPGAFLLTEQTSNEITNFTNPEGASFVGGTRFNGLNRAQRSDTTRTLFEVAPGAMVFNRAEYDVYSVNQFVSEAATRLDVQEIQQRPMDSGYLAFHGNEGLDLLGVVRSRPIGEGRGSTIDISSFADITIGRSTEGAGAGVILNAARLNSFGAESLLIGGLRRDSGTASKIEIRTRNIVVGAGGEALSGPDVNLVATNTLTFDSGARVAAQGVATQAMRPMLIDGDSVFARVSVDPNATLVRTGTFAGTTARLSVNDGARISGTSVVLDSTYAFDMNPGAILSADVLALGAGQVSIVFDGYDGDLIGQQYAPHLVLSGDVLSAIQGVDSLQISTYRHGIDLYGSGMLGGLDTLILQTPEIRGFGQELGGPTLSASQVEISNPRNLAGSAVPAAASGLLSISANRILFGEGTVNALGYADVSLTARNGIVFDGDGLFATQRSLAANTPVLTVTQGARHGLRAGGFLAVNAQGTDIGLRSELGGSLLLQGSSVNLSSRVSLPSGSLEVRAVDGDVVIAGEIDAGGSARRFFDLIRFTDGGEIRLISETGDVLLTKESSLSVAGGPGGGNAGLISISAGNGIFEALGAFNGATTGATGRGGSFELDTRALASFEVLSELLDAGGFTETRNMRIRTGDITIAGVTRVRNFLLSADAGSITVTGTIDASGRTGGRIELISRDSLVLESGAFLNVAALEFDSAGKGGEIRLEAGAAVQGVSNLNAVLDLRAGSQLDLSVAEYVAGSSTDVGSSAFYGAYQGTVHLRAPRTADNADVRIEAVGGTITGASNILIEGYRIFDLTATGGLITGWRTAVAALPAAGTVQRNVYDSANSFLSAGNHANMMSRLFGADAQGLAPVVVIAPGAEIINRTGSLTLGLTNEQILATAANSAVAVTGLGSALINSADWNLSDFRFGPRFAPGVLTLRAAGNLVFNNALSDGFTPIAASTTNANSPLWLGQLRDIDTRLPDNLQSWSYRLTAGADLGAAGYGEVVPLGSLPADSGSLLVGEFYPAIPNNSSDGNNAAVGATGLTANNLRIAVNIGGVLRERGTRYEVIRSGTGSIRASAARDIQLRNQYATIYTAGARIPLAQVQSIFGVDDFRPPTFFFSNEPADSSGLGAPQQYYGPLFTDEADRPRRTGQWSKAGGDISLFAGADIARVTRVAGSVVTDASRQSPNNWLYRRGYVDPETGKFGSVSSDSSNTLVDPVASTTWFVDFSNFFQGVGALGGGNIQLIAGNDVTNVDAVAPTNARMSGRDASGEAIAPDPTKLLELGGGDVTVRAGASISGGIYYVERGVGTLAAQREITTNSMRSPSFGSLVASNPILDSRTWLPTTLFLGKGGFNVTARQDILLGPTLNTFLLPQALQNKTWYRTFFNTYGEDAFVNVTSFGGDITHRLAAILPNSTSALPIFQIWQDTQNSFNSTSVSPSEPAGDSSAFFQPWLRLAEGDLGTFGTAATVAAPILRSTAFGGSVNLVGSLNLFPSAVGNVELLSAGQFVGLQPAGIGRTPGNEAVTAFVTARINVSDAPPSSINGVSSPSGRNIGLAFLSPIFEETGSITGVNASTRVKQTLHDASVLHGADTEPVRIYALDGDIEALTLFSPKQTRILAERDITNVAFYLQHAFDESISIVSAGRDIVPSNANAPASVFANDRSLGNFIVDQPQTTVLLQGNSFVTTTSLSGDIQLGGRGFLEVLAGRNLNLGTGPNLTDGRGVGITTIGRNRNPFLPFDGAGLLVVAGVGGRNGGPAAGLINSDVNLEPLALDPLAESVLGPTREHQALEAFNSLFGRLRDSAAAFPETGSYDIAFALIDEIFGSAARVGDIFTQARDIRTTSGGSIVIAAPAGSITMAPAIFGNPLTPPGIVTEFGGPVSIFTEGNLDIGQARIFTLRGGDITIWSTSGDIAAGTAAKTVVSAPPTRVLIDSNTADVQTDLGGLATGGGIGVLASVEGVKPGAVNLIAPQGTVDAGDAGIRATGDINISAVRVLNADTIQAGGTTTGVPSAPPAAIPNVAGLSSGASSSAAALSSATEVADAARQNPSNVEETPSLITVEVLGYGGADEGI